MPDDPEGVPPEVVREFEDALEKESAEWAAEAEKEIEQEGE